MWRIQKWSKILGQINQKILKASKNNCNSSKDFQLMCPQLARTCWGCSTGWFIYSFLIQVISDKTLCSKSFTSNLRIFLHENNRNYISFRFSYKFAFILFLSFLTNQKQESGFQQVGGLVTRNIFAFCLQRVALYFKGMPNSIDFLKECSYMLFLFVL